MMDAEQIQRIVEAALLAADEPLTVRRLAGLFAPGDLPAPDPRAAVREAIDRLHRQAEGRACELAEVASGFRYQVRRELSPWVARLFEGRPPRYSRALLETLALIVYRQPATRGDIEQVRGVAVSASTIRTLLERGWIRAVGQRDTPGRPTLYGTTRAFLDYFSLKSLDELPPLEQIKSFIEPALAVDEQIQDDPPAAASETGEAQPPRPLAEVVQLPTAER